MNASEIEKYSSAITLSDMEIFVFPELMYSLVLANIMSPIIWQWREEDCFKKLESKTSYRKLMRLKQFIMDEYEFNLDLETWGLTDRDRELQRFAEFISPEQISQSNALFGYEGDKYYFDVDIRKHFGLDKYNSNIIPYWKTETVEAMNAFRHKPGYKTGAGECVSLSALYAAAAFIVCGIPLEDIFMILTPLHSQNFIDLNGGIITNNRRLVTKTMWFNGTAITNKAQRAIRNERVTIVTHCSGHIHCLYPDATIGETAYEKFTHTLKDYLCVDLNPEIFANFLRTNSEYQKYFQVCRDCRGHALFIKAETLFKYEHGSNYRIADKTHDKLLAEVYDEEFNHSPLHGRIRCDELCDFLDQAKPDLTTAKGKQDLTTYLASVNVDAAKLVDDLADFIRIIPKLPSNEKKHLESKPIKINPDWDRSEVIDYLNNIRSSNKTADLAFYAYRDMDTCDWQPFIKAAVERNPVSLETTAHMSIDELYNWLNQLPAKSIYQGNRLAQPDEVANYNLGDGLEKAFLLANVIRNRIPEQSIKIIVNNNDVTVEAADKYGFESEKNFEKEITITP